MVSKDRFSLPGIVTVLNTPFTERNEVDLDSLCANVEAACDAGVAGFLVPAMASEVAKLSDKERYRIVDNVLGQVRHRVPVIAGTAATTQAERLRHARQAIQSGSEGILVSIPYDDEQQYREDVRELAALAPGFLMIQDWDFGGYGLPVSLIQELFDEIDAFRCLKIEVKPAGRKYTEVREATRGKLHVSGGWAVMQFIEALDRGVDAFMPTGMHEVYTAIYSLYHHGQRDRARRLFNELLPVLAFSNQHLDISIHFFKRLLYKQGIYGTPRVRQPILPFDGCHERVADELIGHAIHLIERVREGSGLRHTHKKNKTMIVGH